MKQKGENIREGEGKCEERLYGNGYNGATRLKVLDKIHINYSN